MRHFMALLVMALFVYFLWYLVPQDAKFAAKAFVMTHLFRVIAIVVILLAGLVTAFYIPAFKLL